LWQDVKVVRARFWLLRVLVTGGAGFIGSCTARAFVSRGCPTLVVDDLSAGAVEAVPAAAAFEGIDIRQDAFVRVTKALRLPLIVHAAAQTSVPLSIRDPSTDYSRNVHATLRVVEAAKATNSRVVFLSSGGASYGETAGASEDQPPQPLSPYGRHKLQAEEAIRSSPGCRSPSLASRMYTDRASEPT
jgi:UDP-glucose 4-epimerase